MLSFVGVVGVAAVGVVVECDDVGVELWWEGCGSRTGCSRDG